jgi:type II secretory pathway pseudopilin PulG
MISISERKQMASSVRRGKQLGMSLLETVIALTILVLISVGIMSLTAVALETTENQGHLQSRVAEYAQDKMEQLISLAYGDGDPPFTSGSDTTTFPAASTGGTGLKVGGSFNPSTPVTTPGTGYVDYLDISGNLTTSSGAWYYIRVWQIDQPAGTTLLKRITVTAQVRNAVGGSGTGVGKLPTATVVSLKTSPF